LKFEKFRVPRSVFLVNELVDPVNGTSLRSVSLLKFEEFEEFEKFEKFEKFEEFEEFRVLSFWLMIWLIP
jgi:hypothetical protein